MDNQKTKPAPTMRFNLPLCQPTDDQYNEFSYAKIVTDSVKKKQEQDALEDVSEDQKLIALAKKFEEKYGSKNKRMIRDRDYMDIGYGYDSEDSFVDDSEAYDEFVPHSLDTKYGGFYINTGDLEFKESEEVDPDELDFKPKKVPIKKQLSGTPQSILASKKIKLAKQRKAMMQNPQAATNLKTKVRKLPLEKSQLLHAKVSEGLTPVNKIGSNINSSSEIISSLLQSGSLDQSVTTSSLSNLQTSLLASTSNAETSNSTLIGGVTPSDNLLQHILSGSLSAKTEKLGTKSSPTGKVNNKPASESATLPKVKPTLPDGIPESLLSKITLLEMSVTKDVGDSKLTNKMRTQYDSHIVEIDHLARQLSLKMRVPVFEYVAYILGVSKQTLTGKIKKAIRKKEDIKIKIAMDALKKAIDARMPALLSKHEESIKALGLTLNASSELLKGGEDDNTSDLVIDLPQDNNATTPESQDSSKPRRVRKTFHWDEEMRRLLNDVMKKKINAELAVQRRVTNWEEILTDFIESEVKPLWPKGWMPKSVLLKISEPVCKPYTSQQDNKSAGAAAAAAATATSSTTVTTKKVVKQPKDVAVKKEVLATKPKPPAVVTTISTQHTNSTVASITSAASHIILTIPKPSVTKLTTPTHLITKTTVPPVTINTAPPAPVTINTAPPPPITKNTAHPPPVTKNTAHPALVTKNTAPAAPHLVINKYTMPTLPVTKHTATPPATTKYTTLTVGSVLQARPIVTSSANLLPSTKAMPRPVVMNIPNNAQLQLQKMLAMSHPIMQLATGEGSQMQHSSTVTMSLPMLPTLATTLVNQKHSESQSQWRPSPSSSVQNNVTLISAAANTVMRNSEVNKSSSDNNHQVLQEHSYQRAEDVKSTVSNALPLSKSSANDNSVPKLFISPVNSPFK